MMPLPISDLDLAFPTDVSELMLPYDELPPEFQSFRGPWCEIVLGWFYKGLDDQRFRAKQGIDEDTAWRHLRYIMGSWEPKQEHKIGGVAWLMSQWFEEVSNCLCGHGADRHNNAAHCDMCECKEYQG